MVCWGLLGHVQISPDRVGFVMARCGNKNRSCGRHRCVFEGAERDESWSGCVLLGKAMSARVSRVEFLHENHHRAGTEADRRGRGGITSGETVSGNVWQVWKRLGNHTRAGRVPDRRGRCGMYLGRARLCAVRLVATRQCRFSCGWFLNHARAGTGLDQRQRRGMNHGVAFLWFDRVWRVRVCCVRARFIKPPRGRRGSGFDAGWWDRFRSVGVRQC